MSVLLTDEVWAQLDPSVGRLSRRAVVRLWTAGAVVAAVLAAAGLVWWSGAVVARLDWPRQLGGYAYSAARGGPVSHEVTIVNHGRFAVEIVGIGRDGPGLRLLAVSRAFADAAAGGTPALELPSTLDAGAVLTFTVVYAVTDCAAVTGQAWPLPIRVRRPWGAQTVYVSLPTQVSMAAPQGSRTFSGPDPFAVQWQRNLADRACAGPS